MKRVRVGGILVSIAAMLGVGCAAQKPQPPIRIEFSGTPGAKIEGFYMVGGSQRVRFDAVLPTTLSLRGVSRFAVRKSNPADALRMEVHGPQFMFGNELAPNKAIGLRVEIADGGRVELIHPGESLDAANQPIMVINPYWHDGTWVFDDPATGLKREPFVEGVPEMINYLVRNLPEAKSGFRLTFSDRPFAGYQEQLHWVRPESGGNRYRLSKPAMEGWLCPALFRYFPTTPKQLYVRADPKVL